MSNVPGGPPGDGVPTLTEVVVWPSGDTELSPFEPSSGAMALDAPAPVARPAEAPPPVVAAPAVMAPPVEAPVAVAPAPMQPAPPAATLPSEEELIERVVNDLQRQMDLMLDYRLREILTPILTRAADGVVRDARTELASTLRDVVARVVAQELARHRHR